MQRDIADPPATAELETDAQAPGPEPPGGQQPTSGKRHASRWALALEGLVVYVVLQVLTYPFLPAVRDRGQTFYNDVLIGFFGPEKHGLAKILRAGILPTWVNDQFGGEPFIANLQHAVFYPGNLPFWFLRTSLALEVVCAVHVAFAGLAMWAYCRFALRTSRWGAALAGLAFGFGSVTLQHIILMNQLQVIAWMPVVLLFGHLALEQRRLRWVLLTGVAVGMQLLAGHPEEWVYTLLTLAVYGAAWVLAAHPRQWPRRALGAALSLGGALVAFGLLFAWQLLPTLLLQSNGYRTNPTFSQQFPLPKAMAFNALLPDFGHILTGENVAFIGVVALALAGLGIAAGPRRLLWVRSSWLLLAVFGIIMALGNQDAIYRFFYQNVHLVQQFRVPGRYLLLTYFSTAAAAGLGMDVLLYGRVGQLARRAAAGVGALAVTGVIVGTALLFGGASYYVPSRRWWILAAGLGVMAWALANFRIVPRVVIALLLIGVTGVELRQARPGAEYHEMVPNVIYDDPGPIMQRLGQDGGRYVSIAWDTPANAQQRATIAIPPGYTPVEANYYVVSWPRRLAARPAWEYSTGAETITGRDGGLMPLNSYTEFFNSAVDPKGFLSGGITLQAPSQWGWTALDFLGVRWFVTTTSLAPNEQQILEQHGFKRAEQQAFFQLWERPALPMARMVYQADVVPSEPDRIARLKANYPLLDRVMLDKPVGSLQRPAANPVVNVVDRAYSKVEVSVQTPTDGVLALPDPYYPQWGVEVDGKPAKLLEVDHAFRGVKVPAGSHRVVFTYQDRAMQLGAVLSLLTCLGLLGGWLWLLWSRRRTRDDATEAADGEASRPAESNGESNGEAGGSAGDELPTTTARASSDGDSSKPVG
jgi:Bacterial membrane protein YfhO